MGKTLFDKLWNAHVVKSIDGGREVIYIDQHLIHEVTSPQAFNGLKNRGIGIRKLDKILATADHNVPTINQHKPIEEPLSRLQVDTLQKNCEDFGVTLYNLGHEHH